MPESNLFTKGGFAASPIFIDLPNIKQDENLRVTLAARDHSFCFER